MGKTMAVMFTLTTYGTWLRGDKRGWVSDGRVLPPDPMLENADRQRMKESVFLFPKEQLLAIGAMIGPSLQQRVQAHIWALTVQTWHVHIVVAANPNPVNRLVKCLKDSVRWGLRLGRPIWTDGYDKRFCFDEQSLRCRIEYVERHNLAISLPAKPWPFIEIPEL